VHKSESNLLSMSDHIHIPDFLTATLVAAGSGAEIIHHHLNALTLWTLEPNADTDHFETIYMLSGRLRCMVGQDVTYLSRTELKSFTPSQIRAVFQAEEESEFLYVTSKPVYQSYFGVLNHVRELAVDIEEKDGYTADHCTRIMKQSLRVGVHLGLHPDDLYRLQFAAFFHDIGKIRVPLESLTKASALTAAEWAEMKRHPTYGRDILSASGDSTLAPSAEIVEQHHERYDGSGYPFGLQGDEIHICAAIIGVVDSYDAMTSQRAYQPLQSHEAAINEIRRLSGSRYHPRVVERFLALFQGVEQPMIATES